MKALKPNMIPDEAQFRYDVFGGSARNFKMQEQCDHADNPVKQAMRWYFPDIGETKFCDVIYNQLTKDKHPDRVEIINSMVVHRTGNNERIWASKFMQVLAAQLIDSKEATIYTELEKLFQAAGMGNCFESIGHLKLNRADHQYNLLPLYPKNARRNKQELSVPLKYPVMLLRAVDQIKHLPKGKYGLPVFSSFPLVDAIIQPDKLLQFTISPTDHKGSIDSLPGIRKQLDAPRKDHKMIFVVPIQNLLKFRYQAKLGDISQYVTTYEEAVADMRRDNKKQRIT